MMGGRGRATPTYPKIHVWFLTLAKNKLSLNICGGVGSRTLPHPPLPRRHLNPQLAQGPLYKMAQNNALSRPFASVDSQTWIKNSAGIYWKKSHMSVDLHILNLCCSRVKCTLTLRPTDKLILIYDNLVFPLRKHFSLLKVSLFFQFTDEDSQNKVGTLSRGGRKVSIKTEGRAHQNKQTNCTAARQPKWNWPLLSKVRVKFLKNKSLK